VAKEMQEIDLHRNIAGLQRGNVSLHQGDAALQ